MNIRTVKMLVGNLSLIFLYFCLCLGHALGHALAYRGQKFQPRYDFPRDFKFGAATSAFQTEGGWDADGKGPSIWDEAIHSNSSIVKDGSNADISGDSYNLFDKDLEIIKELGLDFYRFSISWPRILPNGDISSLNPAGVKYYNMIIDKLLANNIAPLVTMFHFDLPAELQKLGGTMNPIFVDYFARYAKLLFDLFGDRVKNWVTINEPRLFCHWGYGDAVLAPRVNASGIGDYLCGQHMLKAHTAAYNIYKKYYYPRQRGRVGIVLEAFVTYMGDSNEMQLDDRAMEYYLGWMANPLFSKQGDYPELIKKDIGVNSRREGRAWSRLPELDERWINSMKGSCDFLGLNYYTSQIGRPMKRPYDLEHPSFLQDLRLDLTTDPSWPSASSWLKSYPRGLRDILNWIKYRYGNVEVIITENGWSDEGQLDDKGRVDYLTRHLQELLNAIHIDRCNVKGYTYWSLLDSFEWAAGYSERFGLYSVDFNGTMKSRTPKQSAILYKNIIKNRKLY